jgi:hypothetical protein
MTISAKHVDIGTVQITNYWDPASGLSAYHNLAALTNTISDAITGTASGAAGTKSGVTFTAASGITPQATTGWTLADEFWGYTTKTATRTAAQPSPIFTQVFKSACADGNSTKNIIIRYNTVTQEILTTTCEKYDVATRTISNEAWTFYDCAPVNYNLSYSDIIIIVGPRHLVFTSYIAASSIGVWAGVFECAREDAADVATAGYPDAAGSTGYPCWGWISSVSWGMGALEYNRKTMGGDDSSSAGVWSLPRDIYGNTGFAAATNQAFSFGLETYPPTQTNLLKADSNSWGRNVMRYIQEKDRLKRTQWSSSPLALPVKPVLGFRQQYVANQGQIYGLKILNALGLQMDQVTIPVDTNGNADSAGTSRRHWLLNTHQKFFNDSTYKGSGLWNLDLLTTLNKKASRHVSVGSAVYVIATADAFGSGNFVKIDRFTRTIATPASMTTYVNSLCDLIFDGERYIYISNSSVAGIHLIKYDITTDTAVISINVPALTTAGTGAGLLAINGNAVYMYPHNNGSGAAQVIARYDISAGTISSFSYTLPQYNRVLKAQCSHDGYIFHTTESKAIQYINLAGTAIVGFSGSSYAYADFMILSGTALLVVFWENGAAVSTAIYYNLPSTGSYYQGGNGSGMGASRAGSGGVYKNQGQILFCPTGGYENKFVVNPNAVPSSNFFNNLNATSPQLNNARNVAMQNESTPSGVCDYDAYSMLTKSYGGEIMATTNYGLNVYQNLHGDKLTGGASLDNGTNLAQVAIPS